MMQTLPFTPATTPVPTNTYVIIYYAMYFWLKLSHIPYEYTFLRCYFAGYCVLEFVISELMLIFVQVAMIWVIILMMIMMMVLIISENYETLDTSHNQCLRLTLTYLLASITLTLTCSCNISQEQNK